MSRSTLGAIGGAALGFFVGGPTGARIGWTFGSFLFADPGPNQEGPRLDSLAVESLDYGTPIPICYGRTRIAGFRMWQTDIEERTHTEEVGGKGGPSATSTTYTYYGHFAVGLCEGPISGIAKIWADNTLIYDVSSSASVESLIASAELEDIMTIYTGSSTQSADSVIQADVGAANTPAYRNTAYIVFEGLPLEKHGNRIPNITAEVVVGGTAGEAVHDGTEYTTDQGPAAIEIIEPYAYVVNSTDDTLQVLDISDPDNITEAYSVSLGAGATPQGLVVTENYAYVLNSGTRNIQVYSVNAPVLTLLDTVDYGTSTSARDMVKSGDYLYTCESTSGVVKIFSIVVPSSPVLVGAGPVGSTGASHIVVKDNYAYVTYSLGDVLYVYDVTNPADPVVDNTLSTQVDPGPIVIVDNYLYLATDTSEKLQIIDISDPTAPSVITSISITNGGNDLTADGNNLFVGTNTVYAWYDITDRENPSLLASRTGAISESKILDNVVYGITDSDGLIPLVPANSVTASTKTLGDIVSDICVSAGLATSDIDVTELTDTVDGYIITRNLSARSAIAPLQSAYFFDGAEYNNKIHFIKRGGSSIKTISADDLGAADYGSNQFALKQTRMQNSELPSDVTIGYISAVRDYEIATQRAQRINYSVPNTIGQELAIVMSDDKALQIADIILYNAYVEREKFDFYLTNDHIDLNPTNVITIPDGDTTRIVRLTRVSYGDVIECEAISDDAQVYTSTATAATDNWPGQTISNPGATRAEYLDIPLLRNADNDAGLYYAVQGYKTGWPGAQIFKSLDGGVSYSPVDVQFTGATMGIALDTLADADPTLWDRTSTLTVNLVQGSLSSATETAVIQGANYLLVGSEIIQFANATLNADGTYTIDTLLRGRRGTEWATDGHSGIESVVLLTESSIGRFDAIINTSRRYKAVTVGRLLEVTPYKDVTNTGINLKPFSPAFFEASVDGSGNITYTWMRRSRYIGPPLGTRPLFEDSENYEVDIKNGSTVVRTLTANSETVTYTSAQQTADGFDTGSTITAVVYQMSDTVGRGYGTEVVVTGGVNVVSLLHMDGTDASTTFTDETGKTWTANGNAQIDTAYSKFGTASGLFDGNGDYVTSPSSADFGFGTDDWTVEGFFRPTSNNTNGFLADFRVETGNSFMVWCSQTSNANKLGYSNEVGTGFVAASTAFTNDTWQHWAVTRESGTVRGFVGGTKVFETTDSRDLVSPQGVYLGSSTTASQGAIGNIDEVRIVKGSALYTADFTPPSSPFPDP